MLLLIILVSLALRLSGVFWGLPYIKYMRFYHPDESKIIDGAYEFPVHILTNLDLRYPTAFHYTLGILSLPLRLLPYPDDYYAIYLVGRVLSVLAGAATIFVTFLLVRKIFHRRCALLAAFLIGFSMLHVANSAWATTDVLSSLLMTLFLLLLLNTLETESRQAAIFTGISLGFLIGVKYTGAIAIIPLVYLFYSRRLRCFFDRSDPARSIWRAFTSLLRDRKLWIIGLFALGTFLLSTPGLLRHPFAFIASLQYEGERLSNSYLPLYRPETYVILFNSLSRAMGLPLALTAILGIILAFFRRKDVLFALTLMLFVFALYFGSAVEDRYYIVIMPILALFASSFLFFLIDLGSLPAVDLSSRQAEAAQAESTQQHTSYSQVQSSHAEFFQHKLASIAWPSIVGYALTGLVCIYAFFYSLGAVVSRYPDTRTQAARYIAENVPPGSSIGLGYASKDYEHSWHYPRIDSKIYEKRNFIKHPDYIVLSSYDYEPVRDTLRRGILNPDFSLPREYWSEWYLSSPPTAAIFELNEQLWLGTSPEYCLLKTFLPRKLYAPIEFPAPTIEIYLRLKTEGVQSPACKGQ